MSRKGKEALVTNRLAIVRAAETILLHIAASLEQKSKSKEHDSRNISTGTKVMLRLDRHVLQLELQIGHKYRTTNFRCSMT